MGRAILVTLALILCIAVLGVNSEGTKSAALPTHFNDPEAASATDKAEDYIYPEHLAPIDPTTLLGFDRDEPEPIKAPAEEPSELPEVEPTEVPSEPVPSDIPDEEVVESEWACPLTQEEIDLIAQLTMAEAGGEPEEGQRLVIDVILNRMDHGKPFPNDVKGVVYQKNQFSPMSNGGFERCYVRDDLVQLVLEELQSRTNNDVIFFTSIGYSAYGTPLFKVGHHYFSSYD